MSSPIDLSRTAPHSPTYYALIRTGTDELQPLNAERPSSINTLLYEATTENDGAIEHKDTPHPVHGILCRSLHETGPILCVLEKISQTLEQAIKKDPLDLEAANKALEQAKKCLGDFQVQPGDPPPCLSSLSIIQEQIAVLGELLAKAH
jgi:hypothetical protein